jgi:hypothetical protein
VYYRSVVSKTSEKAYGTGCCGRFICDSGCISQEYLDCARRGVHDWLDDGEFCCWRMTFKRQSCHCKGTRWVEK